MTKIDSAFIIDDDKLYTYLLSKQIRSSDLCGTLITFNDGEEALNYLKPIVNKPNNLPSVILLDLNMPILDGWQFLDEFIKLEIPNNITVYIVSSSIDSADQIKASTYKQVAGFITKPVTTEQLAAIFKEVR